MGAEYYVQVTGEGETFFGTFTLTIASVDAIVASPADGAYNDLTWKRSLPTRLMDSFTYAF